MGTPWKGCGVQALVQGQPKTFRTNDCRTKYSPSKGLSAQVSLVEVALDLVASRGSHLKLGPLRGGEGVDRRPKFTCKDRFLMEHFLGQGRPGSLLCFAYQGWPELAVPERKCGVSLGGSEFSTKSQTFGVDFLDGCESSLFGSQLVEVSEPRAL